jgi:uncharacterized membrane protein
VIAILITIMILELQVPDGTAWRDLAATVPSFLVYALSYVHLGIYWSNHHHLFQTVETVGGRILWANLHLLFWLSMVPFATAWLGRNPAAAPPTALYGVVMLLAACAYFLLQRTIIARHGPESTLASAVGRDTKGLLSLTLYAASIPLAFVSTWLADALFVLVALIWFIPDRRIARALAARPTGHRHDDDHDDHHHH